jgi:pimeloyl-ACP methyl ester carboxylesterase
MLCKNPQMAQAEHSRTVYYLPGAGGQLATGLGQGLMDRGFDVAGRETRGEFRRLRFDNQVETIVDDLKSHFWTKHALVLGNSFGCYLFLQAQAQMPAFVGRVLLLSPIVGEFTSEETRTTFSPPRPHRLRELAEAGQFNAPARCEIHVGEEDWQSIPANVEAFGRMTGIPVTVVPQGGHNLGKEYVGPLLDRWLKG